MAVAEIDPARSASAYQSTQCGTVLTTPWSSQEGAPPSPECVRLPVNAGRFAGDQAEAFGFCIFFERGKASSTGARVIRCHVDFA